MIVIFKSLANDHIISHDFIYGSMEAYTNAKINLSYGLH